MENLHLVNYCHQNCTPLLNIMRLPEPEAFALAAQLAAKNPRTTAFYRFADFQNYYSRRMEADARLREAFLALGGKPVQAHPLSFVLEGSEYLEAWFDHGIATKIPLACVLPEHISFTLGDSMAVLAREGQFTMLTLEMLLREIAAHPQGAKGYLMELGERYRYIEAQLWDDTACSFVKIANQLSLGNPITPPSPLSGGYTHRMFRLTTDAGDYAVKLLNPEIMQRSDALGNYRTAEAFEALLEQRGLPILPAKTIGGKKMQQVDGQYLYVFDYFDGRVLKDDEITPAHCTKMGAVLAGIHRAELVPPATPDAVGATIGRPQPPPSANRPNADSSPAKGSLWGELAQALLSSGDARIEGEMLLAAAPMLARVTAAMEDAVRRLPPREALCHNDMDAKNVLWQGEDFRIIDLECLGYADPLQEMLDLAISWAGWPAEEMRFKAFVSVYYAAGGERPEDAALLYDSRRNHIDWLEYNARRALFDDRSERRIGREQVVETIGKIESDQRNRKMILQWMEEIRHG